MKIKFLVLALFTGLFFTTCKQSQLPFQNPSLSSEQRVDDLLGRLSIEEKTALMMNASEAVPRLGIKKYDWWNEALHGVARNGTATVFPQAIGMAASFNDVLLNQVFTVVSDEARIKNRLAREEGDMKRYTGLTMWTPNINIFRDPRWGRGQETYGEDPYLSGIMGVEVIKGLQGEPQNGIDKLYACAKHFAVHSGPEWNRHSFNAENILSRDLWETYLPAFKVAVQKANVKQVMCAYNRFEGEPCCGSDRLLVQILREQWGYNGIVLSDCGAIDNFYKKDAHFTQPDSAHASAAAILSGTDLECGRSYNAITTAVKNGLIDEAQIDVSLKRVLMARFDLGEMDGVSPWDSLSDSLINCQAHHNLALKTARESIVLLQNNGVLPLNAKSKVALLGPNADNSQMQWGNYNGTPKHTTTLYEALKKQLPNTELVFDEACGITGTTESLIKQCSFEEHKGLSVKFWNNLSQSGEMARQLFYDSAIRIGKRDSIAPDVNLYDISAKIQAVFTPEVSGAVDFVFTTASEVKLVVDGKEINLQTIPKSLQVASLNVLANKSYTVEIDWVHSKQGEFRFDIQRIVIPDYAKIKAITKNVDVVIFAGGISAGLEREEANVYAPGFSGGDRTDIELPQVQRDIIASLKAAGKSVILVNFSGSAIGLVPEQKNCVAIIQAWYPGEAGGEAVADVLYGKYNPAGRLPITFYKNVNQLPDFENYDLAGRTYRYMNEEPLFSFGYGLSYTSFEYSQPILKQKEIGTDDKLFLNVQVTNTGAIDGDEVVQVYLRKTNDTQGPVKTLRAFKRVHIPAGKSIDVAFELTSDNLEWWDIETQTMCQHKGEYRLFVGGSSIDSDLKTLDFIVR